MVVMNPVLEGPLVTGQDSRRERAKVDRRERLYEAAMVLFRTKGYEATTVAEISQLAGLAKGTFFNYFPTKDAILRYLGTREIGRLGAVSLSGNGSSALGNLRRMLGALANSLERDRELVCLIFRSGISAAELLAGGAGGFSIQPIASLLIRRAQRQGEVNGDIDPDALAAALDALYLQQLILWCESTKPYPLDERLIGIADLLLAGMCVPVEKVDRTKELTYSDPYHPLAFAAPAPRATARTQTAR